MLRVLLLEIRKVSTERPDMMVRFVDEAVLIESSLMQIVCMAHQSVFLDPCRSLSFVSAGVCVCDHS